MDRLAHEQGRVDFENLEARKRLYLTRFNFSTNTPQFNSDYPIYQWVTGSDGVTDPVVAVDTAPSNPPVGRFGPACE